MPLYTVKNKLGCQGGPRRGPAVHRLPQPGRGPQGRGRSRGDRGRVAGTVTAGGQVADRQQGLSAVREPGRARRLRDRRGQGRGGCPLRRQVGVADYTELDAAEVALQYKRLWMVEAWFRSCKSLLGTRPIYHRCDATIVGHVFCSFLALVMRQELEARLEERGHDLEWGDIILDLDNLVTTDVEQDGKRFRLRSEVEGTCGAVFQAAGVAMPPTVQQVEPSAPCGDTAPGATPPV